MGSRFFKLILAVVICIFIITTCKKDHGITDFEVTGVTVTDNSVKIDGKINSLSDSPISAFGVCYSTKSSPVATDTAVNLGVPKVGTFTASISNLRRNKTYYFKAFLKEGDNYLYDDVRSASIAAIAPGGTSAAATGIGETSATLNGSVNPNGCPATWSFEYGTTTSYGSTANPTQNVVTGESSTSVSVALSSLTSNTTYHFRIKVTGAGGTVYGEDLTFKTSMNLVASSVISVTVTNIANTSATFNASVNPNGSPAKVTFEYGTTSFYGSEVVATPDSVRGVVPTGVTASLTGLTPGTLYHLRTKAMSAGGTTNSDDVTFTTTQPPVASTLDPSNIGLATARLNGQVDANGLSTAITFEYGTTTSYGISIDAVPANASSSENIQVLADISGLAENTTYHYRIKAVSTAGTSYGNDKLFTTNATGMVVPTLFTALITEITQATAISGGNITSNGGATITSSGVCWSTSTGPDINDSKTTDGTSSGTFASSITSLTPGTTYYVRAYATNSAGTGYGQERSFSTETVIVLPTVSTGSVTDITQTTAIGGGIISSDGGNAVTVSGLCWDTDGTPTVSDNVTTDGTAIGSFSSSMTGLTAGTTYYLKAYATNSLGTGYGNQVSFSTKVVSIELPTLTTSAITSITQTSATSGGNVTAQGGAPVTARGVCWNTGGDPAIGDFLTIDGNGTGSFTSNLTSLTAGMTYYVRAYATNSGGTAYGNTQTFSTSGVVLPLVTTSAATGISQTGATLNGIVNANGLASVAVTFEYGLTTTYGSSVTAIESPVTGSTNTAVTFNLTGLTENTQYNYRVKTVSTSGAVYGDNQVFTTLAGVIPTLTTASISSITTTGATGGGNVTNQGSSPVTARGVCWSTTANPALPTLSKTTDGSGTGAFSSTLSGLTPNTLYHVRAYATNSTGTAYGNDITFTTNTVVVPPTVTTASVSPGITTAVTGGNVTSDGGATVTARGVCWSISADPIATGSHSSDGTGTGAFASNITGLSGSTTYHVRAYATNSAGTSYGSDIQFTTNAVIVVPTVSTSVVTSITTTGASSGGNVTFDGGAAVTERGICWSTSAGPTTSNSKLSNGSGTGAFTASMTSLNPGTVYYVRAYAINSTGTGYGSDVSFTTLCNQPSVTSSAATGVTATAATLNGTINANSFSTSVTFQYGLTTGYGTTVSGSPASATGTSATPVSAAISGLLPNTLYHFRVAGSNCGGTAYGGDQTFTTPCVNATATPNTATGISSTSATIRGTVNANNVTATVSFEYGLTTSYGSSIAASPGTVTGSSNTPVSAAISGLTPNTPYHFRVTAVTCLGTTYSSDQTFNTSCIAPVVTTNAVSGIGQTFATFNGTVNPSYGNATVSFDWGTSLSYGNNVIAAQSPVTGSTPVAVNKAMTGLNQNTTYYYRIRAVTCYGTVLGSAQSFSTTCAAPVATTMPASSTNPIEGYATLNAIVNASGNSTSVIFEWGISTAYGNTVTASPSSVSGSGDTNVSATLTGLTEGTIYYYRVKATSCYGIVFGAAEKFTLDIDGNVYHMISYRPPLSKFSVTWMKENLRTTRYSDYTGVPIGCDTCTMVMISYKPWGDNSSNKDIYGLLYNGYTVNSTKNICPTGWHVATIDEWNSLIDYAGGTTAAGKLKETGTSHWTSPNTGAEDFIGFSARGGGWATSTSSSGLNIYSYWWADYTHYYIRMSYNTTSIVSNSVSDDYYFYIRCKK